MERTDCSFWKNHIVTSIRFPPRLVILLIFFDYIAYAPPKLFTCVDVGKAPPAALYLIHASPRALPLCPYLHNASSDVILGAHLGSVFGLQFF